MPPRPAAIAPAAPPSVGPRPASGSAPPHPPLPLLPPRPPSADVPPRSSLPPDESEPPLRSLPPAESEHRVRRQRLKRRCHPHRRAAERHPARRTRSLPRPRCRRPAGYPLRRRRRLSARGPVPPGTVERAVATGGSAPPLPGADASVTALRVARVERRRAPRDRRDAAEPEPPERRTTPPHPRKRHSSRVGTSPSSINARRVTTLVTGAHESKALGFKAETLGRVTVR